MPTVLVNIMTRWDYIRMTINSWTKYQSLLLNCIIFLKGKLGLPETFDGADDVESKVS